MKAAMIIGWLIAAALATCWIADSRCLRTLVKTRENARDLWHKETKRLREEVVGLREERNKLLGAALLNAQSTSELQYRLGRFDRPRKNGRFAKVK